jgi:hypothetical protein
MQVFKQINKVLLKTKYCSYTVIHTEEGEEPLMEKLIHSTSLPDIKQIENLFD